MTLYLEGQQFGRLLVLNKSPPKFGETSYRWECKCLCGSIVNVPGSALTSGKTKSCGCYRKEVSRKRATKHGYYKTKIHEIWRAMHARCTRPKNKDFYLYGARGIVVCERWQKFENFLADMGERPLGRSLDRIDNNSGYCPENCRWATASEQRNNQRPRKSKPLSEAHRAAISRGLKGKRKSRTHRAALSIAQLRHHDLLKAIIDGEPPV